MKNIINNLIFLVFVVSGLMVILDIFLASAGGFPPYDMLIWSKIGLTTGIYLLMSIFFNLNQNI